MRKSWDQHFLNIAKECAEMSTCVRRHVGCVLVSKEKKILATGFNGVEPGAPHCDPASGYEPNGFDVLTCEGANEPPGLTDRDGGVKCSANHAESNALLYCSNVSQIYTCYSTVSPCVSCVKLLMCTGTLRIVFLEEYPGTESRDRWLRNRVSGREWIKHGLAPASIS